jgi:hypothetical protein
MIQAGNVEITSSLAAEEQFYCSAQVEKYLRSSDALLVPGVPTGSIS